MFYLRQIEEGDAKIIFEWQSNPITRQYFFDPTIPSYDEHHTWVRDRVTHHFNTTFIIIDEEEASGIVRLDTYDNKNNSYSYFMRISNKNSIKRNRLERVKAIKKFLDATR